MRMRFTALVALTLVVAIAWYAIGFRPAKAKLGAVRADVTRTKDEVSALTAKLTELQQLKANEKELRKEFAKFEHALPVEPAVSDFILDVQDAADQAGIDFLTIAPSLPAAPTVGAGVTAAPPASGTTASPSPSPSASPTTEGGQAAQQAAGATAPSPVQSISVSLTADGKFFEIEDFVAKLEKLERALRIDTFSLSGGGGDSSTTGAAAPTTSGGAPEVSLSIKLQMFMNRVTSTTSTTPSTSTTTSTG